MNTDNLQGLTLAFIGSGTMGEAILNALVDAGNVPPEQIVASDILVKRGEELKARYGVHVTTDNLTATSEADIVILSVKPQVLPSVMAGLHGRIQSDALVFSLACPSPPSALVSTTPRWCAQCPTPRPRSARG